MKITISSKRKELFWSLVPSFVSLSDLRFSSAVCMVGGQLQRGNHLRRAAHDIFFVIKSFVFEHSSKTTDSRSSEFFNFEPEISHYSKWWKRQVISGRRGLGAGYESYVNAEVFEFHRSLSWGEGGGGEGEKQLDVFLWLKILDLCRGQGQPGSWLQMCMCLAIRFFLPLWIPIIKIPVQVQLELKEQRIPRRCAYAKLHFSINLKYFIIKLFFLFFLYLWYYY